LPKDTLNEPVVFASNAAEPKALLPNPVVSAFNARSPTAVFVAISPAPRPTVTPYTVKSVPEYNRFAESVCNPPVVEYGTRPLVKPENVLVPEFVNPGVVIPDVPFNEIAILFSYYFYVFILYGCDAL
jgi:hypothetical protein